MFGDSIYHRSLLSVFLLIMSLGYLAALGNVFLTTERADTQAGMDVNDVIAKFHGGARLSKLVIQVHTDMREFLETEEEVQLITDWAVAGAPEDEYDEVIAPLMEQRCLECHDVFGEAEKWPLTTYKEVAAYAAPSKGKTFQELAELSHQHLFGMGFIFFLCGAVLLRTSRWLPVKTFLVMLGFVGILADIGGWWGTKFYPLFAYVIMGSGALHGTAFGGIVLLALYEMWLAKPPNNTAG